MVCNGVLCSTQVPRLVLLKREIDILRAVDHPTLIRLEDVYEDDVSLHLVRRSGGGICVFGNEPIGCCLLWMEVTLA